MLIAAPIRNQKSEIKILFLFPLLPYSHSFPLIFLFFFSALLAEPPPIILGNEDIQALVEKLGSDSYQEREKATKALNQIGAAAIPELLEAKKTKDPEVRSRAQAVLRNVSADLVNQLESDNPGPAYQVLKQLGKVVFSRLAEFDRLSEPKAHYLVARLFANIRSDETSAYLVRIARESQDPAREFAVRELGHRRAVKHLLQIVENGGTDDIQEMAADAVIETGDKEIAPMLWKRLGNFEVASRGLILRIIVALNGNKMSLENLEAFLDEKDEMINVRVEATRALGMMALGETQAKKAADLIFEKVLKKMDPLTCGEAARSLARLEHPHLLKFLKEKLFDDDSRTRRAALTAIAAARLAGAIQDIEDLLYDPGRNVRRAAIVALGEMHKRVAVPSLIPLLADTDPDVRFETVMALRRIGGKSPVATLVRIPGVHRLIKSQALVGYAVVAVKAYLQEKSEDAFAEAIAGLIYKHNLLKASNPEARHRAAIALYRMGQKVAEPKILQALASGDPFIRLAAAELLGPIGREEAIPGLIRALDDEAMLVQHAAARSLGSLGAKQAGNRLLEIFLDETAWPQVRQFAAVSLSLMQYQPAFSHFEKFSADPDPEVRLGAASALAMRGDKSCVPAFISILKDGRPHLQQAALLSLRHFSGKTFGFSVTAKRTEREAAIQEWREWWRSQ